MLAVLAGILITGCSHASQAQPLIVEQTVTPTVTTTAATTETLPITGTVTATSQLDAFLPVLIKDPTLTPQPTAEPTLEPTLQPTTPITFTGDSVFGIEMEKVQHGGQMLAGMGTTWIRRNALLWSAVEPIEGARNWSSVVGLEQELAEASRLGLKVILIVRSTPAWARKYPTSDCGPVSSTKMQAFGRFMGDMVERYSQPPFNVKYFEIWNEPDAPVDKSGDSPVWGCWGETTDAYYGGRYYAEALKAAYPLMKEADPDAHVLIGGLLMNCDPARGGRCNQSRFFEGILVAGGGPFFDGVSYHTYDYWWNNTLGSYGTPNWPSSSSTTGPLLIVKSRYLKSVMQKYNITGKQLINTELAVICDSCGTNGGGITSNATYEMTKAYYMAQGMAAAMAEGHDAITWYSLGGWWGSGLWDGTNQKPALVAFGVGRQKIGGADYVGEITPADVGASGIAGYKFKRGDSDVWLLWTRTKTAQTARFDRMPVSITDVLGAGFTPAQSFAIDLKPVYIEFTNP